VDPTQAKAKGEERFFAQKAREEEAVLAAQADHLAGARWEEKSVGLLRSE